ncbi:hypothetical protein ACFU6I_17730 [Streptomyces sp. NPDC057486]|uniref:hypothetical protein n=1 Tax=Streptomyces sp. NPDC057486 TaxID=3346145 RepID=UPI0036B0A7FF
MITLGCIADDFTGATEELDETARLFLLLRRLDARPLTSAQVNELNRRFPA